MAYCRSSKFEKDRTLIIISSVEQESQLGSCLMLNQLRKSITRELIRTTLKMSLSLEKEIEWQTKRNFYS